MCWHFAIILQDSIIAKDSVATDSAQGELWTLLISVDYFTPAGGQYVPRHDSSFPPLKRCVDHNAVLCGYILVWMFF